MSKILIDKGVLEQALEALNYMHEEKCNYMRRNNLGDPLRECAARLALPAIDALEAALAEPAQEPVEEPVEEPVAWECKAGGLRRLTQRQYEAQPDNIKRHYTRIEPVQEPVVWMLKADIERPSGWRTVFLHPSATPTKPSVPLYTSPPQRKPLTEEEIRQIAIDTPNTPKAFARAVERAHEIGE